MSIILKPKIIKIDDFFHFDDDNNPVQIVDIINDASRKSSNQSDFLFTDGSFVYESEFYIDINKALTLGIDRVKFDFFLSRPTSDSLRIKESSFIIEIDNHNEKSSVFDKRTSSRNKISGVPNRTKDVIFSSDFSLMKNVSNEIKSLTISHVSDKKLIGNFISDAKSNETQRKQDTAFVLASGKFSLTTPNNAISFGISNSSDANVDNKNFEKISRNNLAYGISLKEKRSASRESRRGNQENALINSLINSRANQSNESTTNVFVAELSSDKNEYLRHFSFDKSLIQGASKIFLRISADIDENINNTVIEPKIVEIDHIQEVDDFLHCPEPPTVKILESSFSKAMFQLDTDDPTLKTLKIVRITKNQNLENPIIESRGTINFNDSKTIIYEDEVDNIFPSLITYRFIAVNNDDTNGEFSSVVLPQNVKISDRKNYDSAKTPITIRALNKNDYVDVSVDILTNDIYTLRLLRQDLSLTGAFSDSVVNVKKSDEYETFVNGERTTLQFQDFNTSQGRHYRYFCSYRLGSGVAASISQEIISDEDENIVRRIASDDLPFTPTISSADMKQNDEGDSVVVFQTSITETRDSFEMLFDALKTSGVSSQFLQDLQNDRQKIKQVVAFLIERIDKRTGKRESFGVYSPGKFEDSKLERRKKNVSDPVPGRKYEYVFKMCIRPPESFLLTALAGFTSTVDPPGVTTRKLAARFQGSLSHRGILPSDTYMRNDASIDENFSSGQTGVEISSIVSFPNSDPVIKNFKISYKKRYNILSWMLSGNLSKIGYCLIYCNYNGREELLGAVSATGSGVSFKYKDERYAQEVGIKKYRIILMTNNNEQSISSAYVDSSTMTSVSQRLFNGTLSVVSRSSGENVVVPVNFDSMRNAMSEFEANKHRIMQEEISNWSPSFRNDNGMIMTNDVNQKSLSDDNSVDSRNDFKFGLISRRT